MTILLYKDGRLVIDDGNPIEGISLEGLVACVSDPQSGDTLKFDGNQWVAGAAASGLPDVSGDDNGKVLTVVDGAWAAAAGGGGDNFFYVNVVWSEEKDNYILDKTAAEIVVAANAKKFIVVQQYNHVEDEYSNEITLYTAFGQFYINITSGAYNFELKARYGNDSTTYTAHSADDYPEEYVG